MWAGTDNLRVLQEALAVLPEGVLAVSLRTDTAGYQHDMMSYCAEAKNERFGIIDFAIGMKVTESFKQAMREVDESEWSKLCRKTKKGMKYTGQEYAEVCFVPGELARKKNGPVYRYVAIREMLEQTILPVMEEQHCLPFQTMGFGWAQYVVFGIVTNRHIPAAI